MQERLLAQEANKLLDKLLENPPRSKTALKSCYIKIKRLIKLIALPRKNYYIIWKMEARFQVLYEQYKMPRGAIVDNSHTSTFDPVVDAYINFVRRVRQYTTYVLENPN